MLDDLPKACEWRDKVCAICHTSGHNRAKCNELPCHDVNLSSMDTYPELLNDIRTLQRELKVLRESRSFPFELLIVDSLTETEKRKRAMTQKALENTVESKQRNARSLEHKLWRITRSKILYRQCSV